MTDRTVHRLTIVASEPGQVFRVTDGRAARVAAGMFHMAVELPRGLYSVAAMTGRSVETRAVVLNDDRTMTFEQRFESFGHQIFAQAPAVLTALGDLRTSTDGCEFIAIRGPFKGPSAITGRPQVSAGTEPILPEGKGHVIDVRGNVWAYARYILPKESVETLTVSRPVAGGSIASHVLPCPSSGRLWCAYPAADPRSTPEAAVPLPHFLRLRLTPSDEVPLLGTQSLSDVIFTALAGRAPLPFTDEVLDLIFADDADPLQAMAAAHVASIALAREGRLAPLLADSSQTNPESGGADVWPNGAILPEQLAARVSKWLANFGDAQLRSSPDFIALQQIYGLPCVAGVRVRTAPVLLRSLDALLEHSARADGPVVDDAIWLDRLQVSDTFAYLQWDPDEDAGAIRQGLLDEGLNQFERASHFFVRTPKPKSEPVAAGRLTPPAMAGYPDSGFSDKAASLTDVESFTAAASMVVQADGQRASHLTEGVFVADQNEQEVRREYDAVKRSAANLRVPSAHLANLAQKMRSPPR